ncbi:MAG: phosphodiester glycosidase family protein [Chloroflexota bacterium]
MRRFIFIIIILTLLAVPFVWSRVVRPARTNLEQALYDGVVYQREVLEVPREVVVHVTEIDLTTPGIRFFVTPGQENDQFLGRTTTDFLNEFGVQLALNGSFYRFDRSDRDFLQPLGQTISNGVVYTPSRRDWPVLCFGDDNAISIGAEQCPADTQHGLAGNVLLVNNGQQVDLRRTYFPGRANSRRLEPRTAVALDESGQTMWLVVVDGRRPGYSEGVTLAEFSQMLHELGAHQAINLDGGGSSTLVRAGWLQPQTLNAPAAYPIVSQQRPIATHLGVYAPPLSQG